MEHGVQNTDEPQDRTILVLLQDLMREATTLVRQEVSQAKEEIGRKIALARVGTALVAAAGAVIYAGFLYLLLAGILALSKVWAPWLAAAVVGGAALAVGVIMLLIGLQRIRRLTLSGTKEPLRQDDQMTTKRLP